jgi:adenylate cyclase class 2
LELAVGSPENLDLILQRLGFVPRFRYEKIRTEWSIPGEEGVLMIDETPIGTYMELEGPPEWIDRLAAQLGYVEADYLNVSYARLYAMECERMGIVATDMVFASAPVPLPER